MEISHPARWPTGVPGGASNLTSSWRGQSLKGSRVKLRSLTRQGQSSRSDFTLTSKRAGTMNGFSTRTWYTDADPDHQHRWFHL